MKPLRESEIAIVGLGLMGGSLAQALREKRACRRIIGIDLNAEIRADASKQGIDAHGELEAISQSDLIVMATPVRTIIEQLPLVGKIAREGAMAMDLGSTKRDIVCAMQDLPSHLQPIGGHPMCGKEISGFHSADATLYRNATFVLTPLARTGREAVSAALELVGCLDARPIILDAERHDRLVAVTSHLPFAVAAALMLVANELSHEDDLLFDLTASGFRDTSRLAASDTSMMLDILLTNRDNVAKAMREYSHQFSVLAERIEKMDKAALSETLAKAAEKRRKI